MRHFKDNTGRQWAVEINVAAVKRVRDVLGVDLLGALDGRLIQDLADDPVLLVDILYVLCRAQADAACVTDEDFGRSMAGDALDAAAAAFLEELVDFFPGARRGLLRKALGKFQALQSAAMAAGMAKLDDPALDEAIRKAMDETPDARPDGPRSTASPESSGSTPGL